MCWILHVLNFNWRACSSWPVVVICFVNSLLTKIFAIGHPNVKLRVYVREKTNWDDAVSVWMHFVLGDITHFPLLSELILGTYKQCAEMQTTGESCSWVLLRQNKHPREDLTWQRYACFVYCLQHLVFSAHTSRLKCFIHCPLWMWIKSKKIDGRNTVKLLFPFSGITLLRPPNMIGTVFLSITTHERLYFFPEKKRREDIKRKEGENSTIDI